MVNSDVRAVAGDAAAEQVKADAATVRRWAVESETDPRTVRRVLSGQSVRGLAAHRVRRVLRAAGVLSDPPQRATK